MVLGTGFPPRRTPAPDGEPAPEYRAALRSTRDPVRGVKGPRPQPRTDAERDVCVTAGKAVEARPDLSLRDGDGRAAPAEVAKLLDGVLPGALVRMSAREQLTRTSSLLQQVSVDPSVGGDLDRLDALRVAREGLLAAVEADELAESARTATASQVGATEPAFDLAWGTVVREMKRSSVDIAAMVPYFYRARRAEPAAAEAPPAAPGVEDDDELTSEDAHTG